MANLKGGQEGEGKSKMLFFKSSDERYVIKTVKEYELEEFLRLAESYCFHMLMNKDSLLCRFFGLYRIRARGFGSKIVIVMNNAFYSPLGKPCRVYDLKGSTYVICTRFFFFVLPLPRRTYLPYLYIVTHSIIIIKKNRYKRIIPEEEFKKGKTGKDLNFKENLCLGTEMRKKFLRQIELDKFFLSVNNIMDYSLLLGVFKKNARKSADFRKDTNYKSLFQSYYGGMPGAGSEGRDLIYYASVIDILQPYDWRKRGETAFKAGMSSDYVHASISAIPSRDYGVRFYNFLYKKTK